VTVAAPASSPTFLGQVADQLVTLLESNKTEVVTALTSAEGGTEAFIAKLIGEIPTPTNFIEAGIWSYLKPLIISSLVALETANPGSVLFTLVDAGAKNIAKELGG